MSFCSTLFVPIVQRRQSPLVKLIIFTLSGNFRKTILHCVRPAWEAVISKWQSLATKRGALYV